MAEVARALLAYAGPRRLITFRGEIGAGKTTLIQALCTELGVTDEVTSPTFSLVNEYVAADGRPVYHIDLYRLDDPEEALGIGIEDYLYSGDFCLLEWPELIQGLIPADAVKVEIRYAGGNARNVLFL